MYVCLCNAVTESEVHDAIAGGACTLDHLRATLKVSNCCGSCEPAVAACLDKALGPRAPDPAPTLHARY
jgi:bacterioferritin-associated ferredoxin